MKKAQKNAQKKSHEVQDGFDSCANQAVNSDKIESASFENFLILQSEDFEAQKNVKVYILRQEWVMLYLLWYESFFTL